MVYELVYIWYMLGICFLSFNLVYNMLYDWYMLGLQRMTRKMPVAKNVWWDFTHSDIYVVYKNRTGILTGKQLFLLYHRYVQYQKLQKMTIFDWYTSFIWQNGICIATFFICCVTNMRSATKVTNIFQSRILEEHLLCQGPPKLWSVKSFYIGSKQHLTQNHQQQF